jgi:RNA polymerase-binding protein DksA
MAVSNEELKRSLLEERARILEHVVQLEEDDDRGTDYGRAGYGNHMADDATETFEQSKDVSLKHNEKRLLEQVNRALEKFAEGTYGICETCGAPIDRARLEAIPYAIHCMKCQTRREQ